MGGLGLTRGGRGERSESGGTSRLLRFPEEVKISSSICPFAGPFAGLLAQRSLERARRFDEALERWGCAACMSEGFLLLVKLGFGRLKHVCISNETFYFMLMVHGEII